MCRRIELLVDFDNVFSPLCSLAPEAAEAFVLEPLRWLSWIAARATPDAAGNAPGRLLVRRCYLNPTGSVLLADGERVIFGSFRANLVQSGFQVLDCPPLTRGGKTSADIVMVMDILDALQHPTRFDEFVLMSSDTDFTPVLQRLRAYDRRTLVIAVGNAAGAYRAAADAVVGAEEFVGGALGYRPEPLPDRRSATGMQPAPFPVIDEARAAAHLTPRPDDPLDPGVVREAILTEVAASLAASPRPLHLPSLGKRLHERLGPQVKATAFGGAGSLSRLLATAGDPRMELLPGGGGGWVRDPLRHGTADQPDILSGTAVL